MQEDQPLAQERITTEADTFAQFEQLKEAEESELRSKLIEYFPDAREVLQSMGVAELKQMVHESLE